MKRLSLISFVSLLAMVLMVPAIFAQQQYPSRSGWGCPWMGRAYQQGQGGWYCPWMGGGMGYGATPSGQGEIQQQYAPGQTPGKPLTEEQAKALIENYLKNTNNPNLRLGQLADKGDFFEADIVTKDGSLADKIQVNKNTGWFRSAY